MLLSVIIPTYRPGSYLFHLLDALCQQTLAAEQFEVILVLNGEVEPYRQQIARYVSEHPSHRLRLLVSEEQGVSPARNLGISEAHGEWLCFVDDDDWPSPSYLEQLAQQAAPGTLVCANMLAIDDTTGTPLPYFVSDAFQRLHAHAGGSLCTYRSFLSAACGKLIPRAVVGQTRFSGSFSLGEDSLFMFAISRHIRSVVFTPEDAVYHVRVRPGSLSRSRYSWPHRAKVLLRLTAAYIATWLRHPLDYNFPLLLTRVAATLRKLTLNHYQ